MDMAYPPGFNPKTDHKTDFKELDEIQASLAGLSYDLTEIGLDLLKRPVAASLLALSKLKKDLTTQMKKLRTNK